MLELDDHQLLAKFGRANSQPAFGALVNRYVNLVYSTALRSTGNPHHAEEITQVVFTILARKAAKLSPRVVLSGWLYQATRLTAANFQRAEARRIRREQEAFMQSMLSETDPSRRSEVQADAWCEIAPLLDEAMGRLGETDRNAVVLRFFQNKTSAEVAAELKLTEAAAYKRVSRALEKLRQFFVKRGVSSTTALIAGAISVNSIHAAPVTLAKSVTIAAVAKGATASTSTLTLIKGALKLMAWTKAKTTIVASVAVLLSVGTVVGIREVFHVRTAAKGKQILSRLIETNRFWLLAPPASVTGYSYVFHLDWSGAPGGVIQTPVHVSDQQKASPSAQQGITYSSALQQLARHPDSVRVESISREGGKIRLALKYSPVPGAQTVYVVGGKKYPVAPLRIACGNGLSQNWRGNFTTGGTNAELVVDAEKMVPLSVVVNTGEKTTVEEIFSDYTEAAPGSYVPLSVEIRYTGLPVNIGDMVFDWKFNLHDGLWLLDESQYRGQKVCWTDQVAVN